MKGLNRIAVIGAALLIPFSLILGYVGFLALGSGPHHTSDAAFATLQLFALEAPPHIASRSFVLNVARFTAPLSLALATIAALLAVLGQHLRRLSLRWRGHDHVVLIGIDHSTYELGRLLLREKVTVVAVDTEEHPQLLSLQSWGAITSVGDARGTRLLRRCHVAEARHLVIAGKTDTHTLEISEALVAVLGPHRATPMHAAINDETLWRQLGRVEIRQSGSGPRLEFFNPADRKAKEFLHLVSHQLGSRLPQELRIEADGLLGRRTLVNLCQMFAAGGDQLQLQVDSSTHANLIQPLLSDESWLQDVLTIEVGCAAGSPDTALVCSERLDGRPLGRALELARQSLMKRVFVCAAGRQGDGVLDLKRLSPHVFMIPADGAWLSPSRFFGQSWVEIMAAARHEDYCLNELARGVAQASNPSLVPWQALPESLRDSNRAFARAVGPVLERLGASLTPLKGPPSDVHLTGHQLELLAMNEHDRWMTALIDDGWTYAPPPKDPHRRTHPLLVAWDELEQVEREKDRDAIRAIPRMLARVGYALDFPAGSDAD